MNWLIGLGLIALVIGGALAFAHDSNDNDGYTG